MTGFAYRMLSIRRDEFDDLRALVDATALMRRSDTKSKAFASTKLRLITDDVEQLPTGFRQEYVRKCIARDSLNGCAWTGVGYIWINPTRSIQEQRRTIMHELCHLAVPEQSHGAKWRRLFGMSLAHYYHKDLFDFQAREEVAHVVAKYKHRRQYNKYGERVPAQSYYDSLEREANAILDTAKRQHKDVMKVKAWRIHELSGR